MEITSDQFRAAYAKLPYPLRDFLSGEEMGNIVSQVGAKYGLHVDTIGAVDRETTNMLLGLINPAQFVLELKSAGIPDTAVTPLVQELNEKVFMPLHAKMQEPGAATDPGAEDEAMYLEVARNLGLSADAVSIAPISQGVTELVSPIAQVGVPSPVTTPPIYVPPAPQLAVAPIQPIVPGPIAPPTQFVPPVPQTPTIVEIPDVRTMASDIQMVKSGGFHAGNPISTASAPVPAPRPIPPPVHVPPSVPTSVPPAMPRATAPQSENREALHEILKSYGVDPYREPAE